MMTREERRGLLFIGLFLLLLAGGAALLFGSFAPADASSRVALRRQGKLRLGSLSGRVLHAHTGLGLPDPAVEVLDLDGISGHWREDVALGDPGRFEFRGLPADRPFRVRVGAPGFEGRVLPCRVPADEKIELGDVGLRPLVELVGGALDGATRPLAGVRVTARRVGRDAADATAEVGEEREVVSHSDERGRVRLEGLLPGSWLLEAHHGALATLPGPPLDLRRGGSFPGLRLELHPRCEAEGRIEMESLPLPAALLMDSRPHPIAEDGSFRATRAVPGSAWLGIDLGSGSTSWWRTQLPARDLRLSPAPALLRVTVGADAGAGWVAVRIRDGRRTALHGGPLENGVFEALLGAPGRVDVLALDESGRFALRSGRLAVGDSVELALELEERDAIAPLAAGWLLRLLPGPAGTAEALLLPSASLARCPSLPPDWLQIAIPPGPAFARAASASLTEVGGILAAPPATRLLAGRLGSASGPPAGVPLDAWLDSVVGPTLVAATHSDANGRFLIEVPAGPLPVRLVVRSHEHALTSVPVPADDAPLEIDLLPGGRVVATVIDEQGRPVPGSGVAVRLGGELGEVSLDPAAVLAGEPAGWLLRPVAPDGRVVFGGLPPGHYEEFRVLHPSLRSTRSVGIEVAGSATSWVELPCYLPRDVRAIVLDADGELLAGARVRIDLLEEHRGALPTAMVTGANGTVQLSGLPPPPYRVRIDAVGHRTLELSRWSPGGAIARWQLERDQE